MALSIQTAITALVNQADVLAGTSTAEDLIYLAKALESVRDDSVASDDAVQAVIGRVNALSSQATAEDIVYLGKAVEAITADTIVIDLIAEGNAQVDRIKDAGSSPVGTPDWPSDLSYDAEGNLSVALYSRKLERYRQTLSYVEGSLSSVLYEHSSDGGETWAVMGTETLMYNTGGDLTGTSWGAA